MGSGSSKGMGKRPPTAGRPRKISVKKSQVPKELVVYLQPLWAVNMTIEDLEFYFNEMAIEASTGRPIGPQTDKVIQDVLGDRPSLAEGGLSTPKAGQRDTSRGDSLLRYRLNGMSAMRLARECGLTEALDAAGYASAATVQDSVEAILSKDDGNCSLHDFLQLMLPLTAKAAEYKVGTKPQKMNSKKWRERGDTLFWKNGKDMFVQNTPLLPPVVYPAQARPQQVQRALSHVSHPQQTQRTVQQPQSTPSFPGGFSADEQRQLFNAGFIPDTSHRKKWKGVL